MLMLGADSTLKPDVTAANSPAQGGIEQSADAELSEQGSGFSTLLNGMVQPAKNAKQAADQRQLIAAGVGLSALSAAMLQATDPVDAAESDLALANNLLLQIAFSNQNADGDVAAVAQEAAEAESLPEAGESVVDGDSLIQAAIDNDATSVDESLSKQAVVNVATDVEQSTQADSKQSLIASDEIATQLNSDTDKPAADVDAEVSATLTTPGKTSADDAAKIDAAPAKSSMQSDDASNSALVKPLAASDDVAMNQDITAKQVQPQATNANTDQQQIAESGLKAELMKAADRAVQTKDSQPEKHTGIVVEPMNNADSEKNASVSNAGAVMMNAKTVDSDSSKAETKKVSSAINSDVGNAVKADATANVKAGTSEQGSQHQHQHQQQSAVAQTERQLAAVESGLANNKAAVEPVINRGEQSFTASLQAAESRQQAQVSKAKVKAASEQLKQAINLQQHDAAGQLRERVNLMVKQNIQIAEIRLDPAGLGQMQIKVDMQQDQANVQFIVQQPQAKELLEQQLPRLREMLQQQGLVLGEGSVQQQSQQERQLNERQQQGRSQHGSAEGAVDDELTPVQIKVAAADRLVDYYA